MSLKVVLIAKPMLVRREVKKTDYKPHKYDQDPDTGILYGKLVPDADEISELAGRQCYLSWDRPNVKTATNELYMHNILNIGHESVLEHAHVVFQITGISRSLLLELERHRFLSFSVLSQRYVDEAQRNAPPVIPPLLRGTRYEKDLQNHHERCLELYDRLIREFQEDLKVDRKEARQAARAVLPNMTETQAVVSANLRAWRYVIKLRSSPAADREIQELAAALLAELKQVAPASFQDL